jgi:hypothetical protein
MWSQDGLAYCHSASDCLALFTASCFPGLPATTFQTAPDAFMVLFHPHRASGVIYVEGKSQQRLGQTGATTR